jgi:hypothetical protein
VLVRLLHLAAPLGADVIGVTLWAWGQPLICTCGEVRLWVGSIWSSGNSQHVADWYSLSHAVHGMLIVLIGRVSGGRLPYPLLLAVAIVTGVAWELVEHTDWVLDRFRGATVYQGYLGDSVLNAVMDYAWMLTGFFVATATPTVWIAGLIVLLEVTSAIFGRDCLTFTTLQVAYPVQAIETYQQAINPERAD